MRLRLAPGESLEPAGRESVAGLLDDPHVGAALVPLQPDGEGPIPAAARRYLASWDARFLHPQTFFAPAARVAMREDAPGWRAADAAPFLARALDEGRRVVVAPARVATPVARSLDAWVRWAREEGEAWGALGAREPRFAPMAPARSWPAWAKHNAWHAWRRAGEATQALRRFDPLVVYLHLLRESAWTGGAIRGAQRPETRR